MPYSFGIYTAPSLPGTWNPAGSIIDPIDWNTLLADFVTAHSTAICKDGQTTITANIPFAGKKITGLGDPTGSQDAATKNYVDGSVGWATLGGLTTSRASATTIAVAAGKCTDSTNLIGIMLASAMTKSIGGAWASGNNSNGMGNGLTIAAGTWYHVFAIVNAGAADVYFDTSVSAANKPASTTAFRRIGSFLTNGSAQIVAYSQIGDTFIWTAPVVETRSGGTFVLAGVPSGIIVEAMMTGYIAASASTYSLTYSSSVQPGLPTTALVSGIGNTQASGSFRLLVPATAQIIETASGTSITAVILNTLGWIDRRGKDA